MDSGTCVSAGEACVSRFATSFGSAFFLRGMANLLSFSFAPRPLEESDRSAVIARKFSGNCW